MNAKLSQERFWHCSENELNANQDDSTNTSQPICEFQVDFPLLRIRLNQDKPISHWFFLNVQKRAVNLAYPGIMMAETARSAVHNLT